MLHITHQKWQTLSNGIFVYNMVDPEGKPTDTFVVRTLMRRSNANLNDYRGEGAREKAIAEAERLQKEVFPGLKTYFVSPQSRKEVAAQTYVEAALDAVQRASGLRLTYYKPYTESGDWFYAKTSRGGIYVVATEEMAPKKGVRYFRIRSIVRKTGKNVVLMVNGQVSRGGQQYAFYEVSEVFSCPSGVPLTPVQNRS